MIGVIADDATGAAEMGAIGWRHGLRAEVVFGGEPSDGADLVCLDTDSRSSPPSEAADRVARAARGMRLHRASWIYKKTDSVLRGNVTHEVEAVAHALGLDGVLLVPANPSLGRTIEGGRYFVRGRPLHETEFARDPRHPRSSADVRELIAAAAWLPITVRRADEGLPDRGLVIGEAADPEDLRKWAALRNDRWLMAGGAEFFGALLDLPVSSAPETASVDPAKALFICGSASAATRGFVGNQSERGVPVFSLPAALAGGGPFETEWLSALVNATVAALESGPRAVLHVGLPPVEDVAVAEKLALHLVRVAVQVIPRAGVDHVLVEGGGTAVALARQMGWHRLKVATELGPGVVTLSTPSECPRFVTVKPGSYPWPEGVLGLLPPMNRQAEKS